MSDALVGGLPPLALGATSRRRWISSPTFDLFFFILPAIVTVPIVIGAYFSIPLLAMWGIVLAFPHYFSSLAFYFWDDNREHQRKRWFAFYAGPVLIAAVYLALVAMRVPVIIQCMVFFWSAFHVMRQNCGILSIYRHKTGVSDPRQKSLANAAILSVSSWFALWNVGSNPEVVAFFRMVHPRFQEVLFIGFGVAAALTSVRLFSGLWRRAAAGTEMSLPEVLFIGTSLMMFYPYLWIRDSGIAMFVILLPHYVQYLGIVWLLHRRRFTEVEGSAPQRALVRVSRSTPLLVAMLLSVGIAFLVLFYATRNHPFGYETAYLLIAFEHFYVDTLIWAFKEPHVRKTIGPWLLRSEGAR